MLTLTQLRSEGIEFEWLPQAQATLLLLAWLAGIALGMGQLRRMDVWGLRAAAAAVLLAGAAAVPAAVGARARSAARVLKQNNHPRVAVLTGTASCRRCAPGASGAEAGLDGGATFPAVPWAGGTPTAKCSSWAGSLHPGSPLSMAVTVSNWAALIPGPSS